MGANTQYTKRRAESLTPPKPGDPWSSPCGRQAVICSPRALCPHPHKLAPAEIFRNLVASNVEGAPLSATQHQIYYRWQQANLTIWRRHTDPIQSAELLLDAQELYDRKTYTSGAAKDSFLHPSLHETACFYQQRASHGLDLWDKQCRYEPSAVLAEVDGAGIPLAYLFIKTDCTADNGAQTNLLDQFLRHFRHSGFMPTFWGSIKTQPRCPQCVKCGQKLVSSFVTGIQSVHADSRRNRAIRWNGIQHHRRQGFNEWRAARTPTSAEPRG